MMKDLLRAASLGLELAAAVLIGAGLGYLFDAHFKTGPIGLVIGLIIGAAAGFWNLFEFSQNYGDS